MQETSGANPAAPRAARVAVILVNWNGWRDTVGCLDTLLAQSHPHFHVVVVDNDSQDGSVERIEDWCRSPAASAEAPALQGVDRWSALQPTGPVGVRIHDRRAVALPDPPRDCRVTLLRAGGNLGFAGGCNAGIQAAGVDRHDYFWLLNTDTVVHRDALAALLARAGREPGLGMVGSTIRWYDRPAFVQCMGGGRMDPRTVDARHVGEGTPVEALASRVAAAERELDYVMGASMLVSSRFVREIGPMQEDYFLYFEEIDWAVRARNRFGIGYAPDSHVFHKSGASSSSVVRAFSTNLYYRNKLRFAARFFPERIAATRRGMALECLRFALRGRWTHARIVAANLWWPPASSANPGGAGPRVVPAP